VFVTGGAGLLGRSFVEGIANAGGKVVIADINFENAKRLAEQVVKNHSHDSALPVKMDITSKSSINSAIENILAKEGQIDVLVNNAYPRNKNYGKLFEEVSYHDFCENVNMHLGGYFLVSQQFSKYFKVRKSGHIITISSIYGVCAPKFEIYEGTEMTMPVEYAVIKSALIHLNKFLTNYFKDSGIRFNTISPGGIFDKQPKDFIKNYNKHTCRLGMLNAKHISDALLFLISDSSEAINGQNIIIDDGWTV
jgi:NAD(P)-dependent dehydrogenase (short-subunit alcohol dehydrogenase family)